MMRRRRRRKRNLSTLALGTTLNMLAIRQMESKADPGEHQSLALVNNYTDIPAGESPGSPKFCGRKSTFFHYDGIATLTSPHAREEGFALLPAQPVWFLEDKVLALPLITGRRKSEDKGLALLVGPSRKASIEDSWRESEFELTLPEFPFMYRNRSLSSVLEDIGNSLTYLSYNCSP